MQQFQPLGPEFYRQGTDSSRVTTGTGKALDQTELDRIVANAEYKRDRSGRSLGREVLPGVAMTVTPRRTKSAISEGACSYWPTNR
jgi:hypothetical protein